MMHITINGRLAKVLSAIPQGMGLTEVFVCPPDDNKPHARHMLPAAWINNPNDRRVCVTSGNTYGKAEGAE